MNRATLALGMAAMEVCWLFAWSTLFGQWLRLDRPLLGPLTIIVLMIGAALATLAALRVFGSRRAGQVVLIALGLVLVLGAVRFNYYPTSVIDWLPELAIAIATAIGSFTAPAAAAALGLFVWYRGVRLASSAPTFAEVDEAFRWGIGALVGFAILNAVGVAPEARPGLEAQATPFFVVYFFVSLLTLALARLESLRSRTQTLAINTQWLGVLIAVAGLLVLLALGVGQIFSFDLLVVATRPLFGLLGQIILLLIYVLVIPLAFVIEWLVYLLLQLLRIDPNAEPPQPPEPSDIDGFIQRLLTQMFPPEVLTALKAVGVLIVLAIALLVIARTVARWRPRRTADDPVEEERDTLWQGRSLRAALLAWLRGFFQRRRRSVAVDSPATALTDGVEANTEETSSVRALYRQVLRLGAAAGAQRANATTPHEHLPRLDAALEPYSDLAELTTAYEQVRYAEQEPAQTDLLRLQENLERVHAREEGP